jgi:flagellar basal body-associated protein FliL
MNEKSFAMELLQDYKKANKRLFIIIIIILAMWFCTIGYLIYILNDIGTIETTSKQEIKDVDTIENSNVTNGDMYGEDKTNKDN